MWKTVSPTAVSLEAMTFPSPSLISHKMVQPSGFRTDGIQETL